MNRLQPAATEAQILSSLHILTSTNGEWPLADLLRTCLGATVEHVCLLPDSALCLSFSHTGLSTDFVLPSPWTYSSCLLAISSTDLTTRSLASDLIGLQDARLTEVTTDNRQMDLVLDSIRISLLTK